MATKSIEFEGEGGTILYGSLLIPDGPGPFGCLIQTQALSRGRGGSTWNLGERLAAAGVATFIYTIRGYEESLDGAPFDQDIEREIRDHKHAITFLSDQPEIDPDRIGFLGISVRGGEAIALAATDRRLRCVIGLVPMMSGRQTSERRYGPDALAARYEEFKQDRLNILHGQKPATVLTVPEDENDHRSAFLSSRDFIRFTQKSAAAGVPSPKHYTLRSQEYLFAFEPQAYLPLISPTPLLMIVAEDDKEVGTANQLRGYEAALEPKRLVMTSGGHFDVHSGQQFEKVAASVVEWCLQWLGTHPSSS